MKVGLFSDVHGNIDALRLCLAVLHDQGVERTIFLGDAVGYLPFSIECLQLIRELEIECVLGNHEAMLLGLIPLSPEKDEFYKLKPVREHISEELRTFVQSWPQHRVMPIGSTKVLLVHGSPTNPLGGYVYPDTDLQQFEGVEHDIIIMGQTHRPFVRHECGKVFINIGSVGLPRDEGNLLSCAVFDTETLQFDILRHRIDTDDLTSNDQVHPQIRTVFSRHTPSPFGRVVSIDC